MDDTLSKLHGLTRRLVSLIKQYLVGASWQLHGQSSPPIEVCPLVGVGDVCADAVRVTLGGQGGQQA